MLELVKKWQKKHILRLALYIALYVILKEAGLRPANIGGCIYENMGTKSKNGRSVGAKRG